MTIVRLFHKNDREFSTGLSGVLHRDIITQLGAGPFGDRAAALYLRLLSLRSARDLPSSPVHPDVADLGHHLIATKAGLTAVPLLFLGRDALCPGLRGASGRGRQPRTTFGQAGSAHRRHSVAALVATYGLLLGHAVRAVRCRRCRQHGDEPGVLLHTGHPVRPGAATWRYAAALSLGIAGLLILFSSKASFGGTTIELWGRRPSGRLAPPIASAPYFITPLLWTSPELTTAQAVVGAVGMGSAVARAGAGLVGHLDRAVVA